jgi:aminoglycoside phosphotransferase (APT) family kinase protein
VHGDFRLGNLIACGAGITAVIDWEIWSVGDPRIDVGWFLVNADPDTYRRSTPYVNLVPPVDELAAFYTDAVGVPMPDLTWFMALACFKSAATWSLIVKHNRRSPSPRTDLEAMAPVLPHLLKRAAALLA